MKGIRNTPEVGGRNEDVGGQKRGVSGCGSVIFPGLPISFNRGIAPNAPTDLFAAIGKNGQVIDVVPSKNLVIVRMGEATGDALVPVEFHDDMWEKIGRIIN